MSSPIDSNIFRVDQDAIRKSNENELQRTIKELLSFERIQSSREVQQEPIPAVQTFPITHRSRSFTANEGEVLMFQVLVPRDKVGFLESVGSSYLLSIPSTYFKVLIDKKPILGYSDADGKIKRQIGNLIDPRPLVPPIVFFDKIEVYGANFTNSAVSLAFTVEGVLMKKPRFAGPGGIVTPEGLLKIVRREDNR